MKKGIFSNWFREFATLVLTQSVQAFLLAIVMTIIISALGEVSDSSKGSSNYAAGMLAIIALSQFGRIELLVKNIFGVTSQYGGGMDSGRGGFNFAAGLALRGARKALDNGGKAVKGVAKAYGNTRRINKYNDQLNQLKGQDDAEQKLLSEQQQADNAEKQRALKADKDNQDRIGLQADILDQGAMDAAQKAQYLNGGGNGLGMDGAQFSQLLMAVNNTTRAIQANHNSPGTIASASSEASNNGKPKDKTETQQKMADIQAKIENEKRLRRDNLTNAASGVLETGADILGAKAGAIVGAYKGIVMGEDIDKVAGNAAEGAGIGIGIADHITESTVGAVHEGRERGREVKQSQKEVTKIINNNVQQIQQNMSNTAISSAKASNPNLSQEEIKKIGQEAAKQSYEKLKNDFKNNYAKSSTGKDYITITQKSVNSKNVVTKAKNSMQKKKIDKKADKNFKDISNV